MHVVDLQLSNGATKQWPNVVVEWRRSWWCDPTWLGMLYVHRIQESRRKMPLHQHLSVYCH